MLIRIYKLILLLLTPLYPFILFYRLIRKKDTPASITQRLGFISKERPKGRLVWIHAASLGESIAAITLINSIKNSYPDINLLVTTGTLSSAQMINKSLPAGSLHQFVPIDNFLIVRKFINHWQPDLGIFIESELWPALVTESAKKCRLILVNARLSNKSFGLWQKYQAQFKYIIDNFSKVITQSERDYFKYTSLGCSKAVNLGNIKFSNKELPADSDQLQRLQQIFASRKVFVAASTHKEDEEIILPVLSKLKHEKLDYYPVIIPRHPARQAEIADYCNKLGLSYCLRSQSLVPDLEKDLYIADSFGELGLFFSLSSVVFVGGSFGQLGGHNLLEPAHFNNAIILGRDMSNYQNITDEMISQKAAIQITGSEDFEREIKLLLSQAGNEQRTSLATNARNYINNYKKTLDNYLAEIKKFIE